MTPQLVRIVIVGAVWAAFPPRLAGQARGTLRGSITDSVTGAPMVAARVAIWCSGCYGRYPTDSAGRYRLDRLPAGSARFEAHCPSATGLGAEITQRTIEIAAEGETVLDLRVPPGHCAEPGYSERPGIFRGYWTPGFESSAFFPCADSALGVPAPLLPGKRLFPPKAWADLAPGAARRISWPSGAPIDSYGNGTYFVVWHGVLKGPGTYGHLRVSEFSMLVDSVIAVRVRGPSDCRTR
jgi:hypothetical protein